MAGEERGIEIEYEDARELVYGMPYAEWKEKHQQRATQEQLARFNEIEAAKNKAD